MMSCDVMWCHCDAMSCDACHAMSWCHCDVIGCHVTSCHCDVIGCHVMSLVVMMSCDVMSYDDIVMSWCLGCHMMSCDVIWCLWHHCDVMWCHLHIFSESGDVSTSCWQRSPHDATCHWGWGENTTRSGLSVCLCLFVSLSDMSVDSSVCFMYVETSLSLEFCFMFGSCIWLSRWPILTRCVMTSLASSWACGTCPTVWRTPWSTILTWGPCTPTSSWPIGYKYVHMHGGWRWVINDHN